MPSWFRKDKTRKVNPEDLQSIGLKPINYHPKIILAWAKAIEGNNELLLWLNENGFEELFMASYAIYLKALDSK